MKYELCESESIQVYTINFTYRLCVTTCKYNHRDFSAASYRNFINYIIFFPQELRAFQNQLSEGHVCHNVTECSSISLVLYAIIFKLGNLAIRRHWNCEYGSKWSRKGKYVTFAE